MSRFQIKGTTLSATGLLFLAAALLLCMYNLWDAHRAACISQQAAEQVREIIPDTVGRMLSSDTEMPVETIDGVDYIGLLRIPALELELPVIQEWSYANLKMAPCRYSGSIYSGDLIVAAHNYPSHFGNLKNLSEGDSVSFLDMNGNVFSYHVIKQEILEPTDLEKMESGDWGLTLFTCTVGGQSRITVRCKLVESLPADMGKRSLVLPASGQ